MLVWDTNESHQIRLDTVYQDAARRCSVLMTNCEGDPVYRPFTVRPVLTLRLTLAQSSHTLEELLTQLPGPA